MRSAFLDKLIGRLDRLDPESVQTQFLRLAQQKGLLEAIFQSIQEGVVLVDGTGRIQYANRAAEGMLGFDAERVRRQPILRYLRDFDWDHLLALDADAWTKLIRHEIEVVYPEPRRLSFYVVPLAAEGGERGAVVILRDVTRERLQEESAIESERLKAVRLLAAGVAHEIGNPLNALTIHLQLVERELRRLEDARRDALLDLVSVARAEVHRLDVILNQFLRAVRPSTPDLHAERLAQVVEATLALLRHEIENRRIRVEVECPAAMPAVRLDRDQIQQAFFNIVKNALHAMADGGRLRIRLSSSDRYAAAAFCDDGKGIETADFGRLFEPFFTTRSEGTGLGLMIVQRIVQDHGGRIDVHSEPGVGTTFTVFLPLDERRVRLLRAGDGAADEAATGAEPPAGAKAAPEDT